MSHMISSKRIKEYTLDKKAYECDIPLSNGLVNNICRKRLRTIFASSSGKNIHQTRQFVNTIRNQHYSCIHIRPPAMTSKVAQNYIFAGHI